MLFVIYVKMLLSGFFAAGYVGTIALLDLFRLGLNGWRSVVDLRLSGVCLHVWWRVGNLGKLN